MAQPTRISTEFPVERRSDRRDRGQAIIMVTVGLTFLLGILGLVVDIGWGYYRKQVAQAAVDSAVLAAVVQASQGSSNTYTCGSNGIICQDPTSCATPNTNPIITSACSYGTSNGVSASNLFISANTTSPVNGANVNYWIKASVSDSFNPFFTSMIGASRISVGASATGGVVVTGTSGGGCIYVLDPSMAAALQVGGASLTSSCGVWVNSNDSGALKVNGSNSFVDGTGAAINIVGGWTCTNGCAYVKPTPTTGAAAADDPLGSVPAPSFSGCDMVNFNQSSNSSSTTLNPGVYCGGIKVTGGSVTFNAGNYILNGGGLSFQGQNTTINGTNVFFYNTSSGYTVGNLGISGAPVVHLTAPASGTYKGILYYRDRNVCPSTNDAITGNTNTVISGSIYLHCGQTGGAYVPATLDFAGESTPGHYVALIADVVKITGNSHLILDPTGDYTGIHPTTKSTYLVQ